MVSLVPLRREEMMDSAKRCRDQSAECIRLIQSVSSETEARLLRSLSQSWIRIANQIERYNQIRSSEHDTARSSTENVRPATGRFYS